MSDGDLSAFLLKVSLAAVSIDVTLSYHYVCL